MAIALPEGQEAFLNKAGVYAITCIPTGKKYVGSAGQNFRLRLNMHRYDLRRNGHHSPKMQNAYNKYGQDAFRADVVLVCEPDMVLFYEQLVIDTYKPEFNVCPTAGSFKGVPITPEHKEKLERYWDSRRHRHKIGDEMLTVREIAERYSLTPQIVNTRIAAGWTEAELSLPRYKSRRKCLDLRQRRSKESIQASAARFDVRGERLTIREISERYNIKLATVRYRVKNGLRGENLLSDSYDSKKIRYVVNGEALTIYDISEKYNIPVKRLRSRLEFGWRGDDLVLPRHTKKACANAR